MNTLTKSFFVLLLALQSFAAGGLPTRQVQDIKSLSVMAYNVENLIRTVGKYERVAGNKYVRTPDKDSYQKKPQDIQSIQKIIAENLSDFVVLEEVEDIAALNTLIAAPNLANRYTPHLIEGNDVRGIDVAMLIRSDLPFSISYETHKDITWFDPVEKQTIPLFSRDLPAAIVRLKSSQNPFLIILGNHAKSKRDRPGDPQSTILRTAQHEMAAKIVRDYQAKFPSVKVILAGDFNTDTRNGREVIPVKQIMRSAFDLSPNAIPSDERITHSFHPVKGGPVYSQLDDLLVTPGLRITSARIIRYRDSRGNILPLPRTYKERSRQPSDHFPVVMEMDTVGLW